MQYTIRPSGDAASYLSKRQQLSVHWMKNAALFGFIASMILSVYAFRTNLLESYTAFKTSLQVERVNVNADKTSLIYFEPDSSNLFSLFKSNLAVINRGTYKLYSPNGSELFAMQLGYNRPGISVSDNYVVAFDRGNKHFSVYEQRTLVKDVEVGGNIISLSQNEDGFVTVVHNDEAYRSAVSVYDNNQNLVYQWKTSDYYIMRAQLSPDNKSLVTVALTQTAGMFYSKIIIFKINEEEKHASLDIEGSLVANMHFLSNDTVCLISDDRSDIIDMECSIKSTYEYGDDTLKSCANGDGYVILSTVNGSSGLSSKLVRLGGDTPKVYETNDEVRKISACGNYVGILYTSSVQMLNSDFKELGKPVEVYKVRDILTNSDGKLMLIYSSEAGYADIITPFQ